MRRPILMAMVVLGLVVTGVAGAGTFAPFTDRATSGTNSVASGERPRAADLRLAFDADSPFNCANQTFVDDSTSPGMTAADFQPGSRDSAYFCLKNAGASALNISVTTIDLVDIDNGCTGDEAAVDTTCGNNQTGELGTVLFTYGNRIDCTSGTGSNLFGNSLAQPTPMDFGTLEPGAILCGRVEVGYPMNRSADDVQRAQSDTSTWKYAFTGTTAA
jgi:predicted ribosomally synthesized peptide with SipW-like signal peptide